MENLKTQDIIAKYQGETGQKIVDMLNSDPTRKIQDATIAARWRQIGPMKLADIYRKGGINFENKAECREVDSGFVVRQG